MKTVTKANKSITQFDDNGQIKNNIPGPAKEPTAAVTADVARPEAASVLAGEARSPIVQARAAYGRKMAEGLAVIDGHMATLRELPADAQIRFGDLEGLAADYHWEPNDILTRTEAIDCYRLERALLRAAATEKSAPLPEYGNGMLGNAEVEGFYPSGSVEWLVARTNGIGGSDKVGFIGDDGVFVPYDSIDQRHYLGPMLATKGPKAAAAIIAEGGKGEEGARALPLRIGDALERTVQHEFAETHPEYVHLADKNSRRDAKRPWHRFNTDGLLQDKETGEFGIFEAKTSRNVEAFTKALPGYRAQCLHNASAAGLRFAVLVADVDGLPEPYVERLNFTDSDLQSMRDAVDRAWFIHRKSLDKSVYRG